MAFTSRLALRAEEESQTDGLTDGHLAQTWPSASPQVSHDHSSAQSCCLSLYHSQSHALNRQTATCRQTVKTPEMQSGLEGPLFSFQPVYFFIFLCQKPTYVCRANSLDRRRVNLCGTENKISAKIFFFFFYAASVKHHWKNLNVTFVSLSTPRYKALKPAYAAH